MKSEFFNQYELEFEMSKCLEFGDEDDIAGGVGVSSGMISQYLNPTDDRESPIFKAAAILAAWIAQNASGGECALSTFCRFVRRAQPTVLKLDLTRERRNSHKERMDFIIAESEHKPVADCIHELEESIDADGCLLNALRAEEKRRIQRDAFPGLKVSHNAAGIARKAVRRER